MPSTHRAEVANVADTWHVPLIDDGSLTDLSLGAKPPPPLASFAERALVYSVGSLSKLFWGGLRIGWVRCPPDAVGPILRLKSVSDLSSSLASQAIAIRLFEHRDAMIEIRQGELRKRVDLYSALLPRHLPWFSERAGGLSLWVDTGIDAAEFAQAALREGSPSSPLLC
jgi:DNA-binding transcriptional MocR family regulator